MDNQKKDSNPKDALGVKKVPLHAVPVKPLLEVGLAMMEGGRKYGTHNYRAIGVRMSTYYNAAMRHLMAWWEGEDIDLDSGVPHLVKAMASLFVVRDGILMGNCVDDRPIQYPDGIDMAAFNDKAACLILRYPECALPFLQHIRGLNPEDQSDLDEALEELEKPGSISLDKLIEELELDEPTSCGCAGKPDKLTAKTEPQFKAGDKVRIKLKRNASAMAYFCAEYNYEGIYDRQSSSGTHVVRFIRGCEYQEYIFRTDELTLVEDN